jgi:hypothetical protein
MTSLKTKNARGMRDCPSWDNHVTLHCIMYSCYRYNPFLMPQLDCEADYQSKSA